jgi:acyl dehydratase
VPLYLEDFIAGQRFRSHSLRVDANEIKGFAAQFDPQPFHLDEDEARQSFFGGLAASGWHTAALTMRLLVGSPFEPAGGIIGTRASELTWPRAVRPGDELHVEGEVLEVRTSRCLAEHGIVKAKSTTLNQRDEPVQVLVMNMLVKSRTTADQSE